MNVLDLPIKKQEQIAREEGMTLAAWRKEVEASNRRMQAFMDELIANDGVRPDDLTDEEIQNLQDKIDSGNPLPKGGR